MQYRIHYHIKWQPETMQVMTVDWPEESNEAYERFQREHPDCFCSIQVLNLSPKLIPRSPNAYGVREVLQKHGLTHAEYSAGKMVRNGRTRKIPQAAREDMVAMFEVILG
jgi:hypothetical protein